ncbi:holin [Crossiella sp. SN42]|uniref:holin n=1 Tax=Crossiella sp. SN42 TaxID=2944808 RepID=UPI0035ABC886
MFTRQYWIDLAERVVVAAAATAASALGNTPNLWAIDITTVTGLALGTALLTTLYGLAGRRFGDPNRAAFSGSAVTPDS